MVIENMLRLISEINNPIYRRGRESGSEQELRTLSDHFCLAMPRLCLHRHEPRKLEHR